jgi:hypothetical protein
MCLTTVDSRLNIFKKIKAYKVFDIYNEQLYNIYYSQKRGFKKGKTYFDYNIQILGYWNNNKYLAGYHAYKNKKDVPREGVPYEVEISFITAEGYQFGSDVVVGKRMKILKEMKRRK